MEKQSHKRDNRPTAAEKKRRRGLKRKRAAARKEERALPRRVTRATAKQDAAAQNPPHLEQVTTPKPKKKCRRPRQNKKRRRQNKTNAGLTDEQRQAHALEHFKKHHPDEWAKELEWRSKYPAKPPTPEPPISMGWDAMVASANEHTTPSKESLWAEPAIIPSDVDTPPGSPNRETQTRE